MILFSSGACHMRAFLCFFSGFFACILFKKENHIKSLASLTVAVLDLQLCMFQSTWILGSIPCAVSRETRETHVLRRQVNSIQMIWAVCLKYFSCDCHPPILSEALCNCSTTQMYSFQLRLEINTAITIQHRVDEPCWEEEQDEISSTFPSWGSKVAISTVVCRVRRPENGAHCSSEVSKL